MVAVDGSTQILDQRIVLHVARMASTERYKGQDCLLEAFPLIHAFCPDVQLVLVGHGDDMPRLCAIAGSLPSEMQCRVFLPGYVSRVLLEQLYERCYLFAMPSSGEGFGLVYLEAMEKQSLASVGSWTQPPAWFATVSRACWWMIRDHPPRWPRRSRGCLHGPTVHTKWGRQVTNWCVTTTRTTTSKSGFGKRCRTEIEGRQPFSGQRYFG